jgi:drug/metabolite transporter (DMT)-like permease
MRALGHILQPLDPKAPRGHVPAGIAFMILASCLFASTSAIAKWQVAIYPVGEVMFFRSLSSFLICSAICFPLTGAAVYATSKPCAHVARGLSQAVSQTLTVLAVSLMPLAAVSAISFSAPLWATLLSVLLLKERTTIPRSGALALGFIGVLIVTQPDFHSMNRGALFALGNAVLYGSVTVAVRGMAKTESASTLLMWQLTVLAAAHSVLLVFGFIAPTLIDTAVLICSGALNLLAQYCWTQALRLGPTAAVSPFYYLTLVWTAIIGFLGWGDLPSLALIFGSAVVSVSCVYLLWQETRCRRVLRGEAIVLKPLDPLRSN